MTVHPVHSSSALIASPSAACRPCPTWSGPVGFADTNSTFTGPARDAAARPYAGPAAMIARSVPASWSPASRKLMKPGPATSTDATSPGGNASAATICWATSRGLAFSVFASTSAKFVATSPWLFSRGVSSSTTTPAGAPRETATRVSSALSCS